MYDLSSLVKAFYQQLHLNQFLQAIAFVDIHVLTTLTCSQLKGNYQTLKISNQSYLHKGKVSERDLFDFL
jgi:hypothetical protein